MEKQEALINWWEFGEAKKPLILASVNSKPPGLPGASYDLERYWEDNAFRFGLFEERLARTEFFGAAVPFSYTDFGSSAMAGNLGCPMRYMDYETVWPQRFLSGIGEIPAAEIDENNPWYKRIYGYLELELARGDIATACYALGGIGDTAASMYGDENLMMDMLDDPEGVLRAFSHIKDIWIREYEKQVRLIKGSEQAGMCGWSGVWAPGGTFPCQEDMSYAISPELFDRFILPQLSDIFDAVEYPLYHLDGKGAVCHLDTLLGLKKLKAIQWVPGAAHEEITQWYPLIERILDAGKSVQIETLAEEVPDAVKNLGTRGLLISVADATCQNLRYFEKFL